MAVSTSGRQLRLKKQSIADALARSTSKQQSKKGWFDTITTIGLPLLASLALPGIGTALAASGSGFLSGLGGLLASTGGSGGILKTLAQLGTKAAASNLIRRGGRGLGKSLGFSGSAEDINIGGDALSRALGRDALQKTREGYRTADQETTTQGLMGDIMGAVTMQGGLPDIVSDIKKATKAGNMWWDPTTTLGNIAKTPPPLVDVGAGKSIIDALGGVQPEQNLITQSLQKGPPGLKTSVDPNILQNIQQGDPRANIISRLSGGPSTQDYLTAAGTEGTYQQQSIQDIYAAMRNPDLSQGYYWSNKSPVSGIFNPETEDKGYDLLQKYYGYEDIPSNLLSGE